MNVFVKLLCKELSKDIIHQNQAYAPQSVQPNYSFPPSDMGPDFFYSPPAVASSLSSDTSELISFDENDFFNI